MSPESLMENEKRPEKLETEQAVRIPTGLGKGSYAELWRAKAEEMITENRRVYIVMPPR